MMGISSIIDDLELTKLRKKLKLRNVGSMAKILNRVKVKL